MENMKLILGTHTVYTDYVYALNLKKNVLEYYNGYCIVVKQGYFPYSVNNGFCLKYLS